MMKKNDLLNMKRHLTGALSTVNKQLQVEDAKKSGVNNLTSGAESCKDSKEGCTCRNEVRLTGDSHPGKKNAKVTVCACRDLEGRKKEA